MSGSQPRHVGLRMGEGALLEPGEVETGMFGFWVFLMSDAVLFALLFAIYGTQLAATAGAPGPADEFKLGSAFWETMVLLTSSLTYGMASLALKYGRSRLLLAGLLALTLGLGVVFIAMELHDFTTMVGDGASPERSGFLSAFFALVSLHGLHVTAGCCWLVVMLVQIATLGLDDLVKANLLKLGLFWHFLDIVWVAIFSVVYLQGVMR